MWKCCPATPIGSSSLSLLHGLSIAGGVIGTSTVVVFLYLCDLCFAVRLCGVFHIFAGRHDPHL